MATTTSVVTGKKLKRFMINLCLTVSGSLDSRSDLHMTYWKALDFTRRLIPVIISKEQMEISYRGTDLINDNWIKRTFENEEGCVREIIKPIFSAASCLNNTQGVHINSTHWSICKQYRKNNSFLPSI